MRGLYSGASGDILRVVLSPPDRPLMDPPSPWRRHGKRLLLAVACLLGVALGLALLLWADAPPLPAGSVIVTCSVGLAAVALGIVPGEP